MLAAKKKKEAAAAVAAATGAADGGAGSGAAAPGTDGAEGPKKISLMGGDDARAGSGASGKRKMSPGEIRIQKDISELDGGTVAKITFPDTNNLMEMTASVTPDSGLWKSATFNFSISVPPMYPHTAPKVMCLTKIYHPNIDLEGHVCLNILREGWKPVLDINTVIYGLIHLFHEPNANDPLNHEAAACLRDNKDLFERNVYSSLRGGSVGGAAFPRLLAR